MSQVLAPFLFAGFLIAAIILLAEWPWSSRTSRRVRISLFILYTLGATGLAGFGQKDMYPFASWPLIAGTIPPFYTHPRIMLVDDAGREHDVDYRAWEPLGFREARTWFDHVAIDFPAADRAAAARQLVLMGEVARLRARAGRSPGTLDRVLGPLTAPEFLLHPKRWSDPSAVPPRPFVGLRLYRETWNLEARENGRGAIHRLLVYAWPESAVQ
jgi:hypothetical protein